MHLQYAEPFRGLQYVTDLLADPYLGREKRHKLFHPPSTRALVGRE